MLKRKGSHSHYRIEKAKKEVCKKNILGTIYECSIPNLGTHPWSIQLGIDKIEFQNVLNLQLWIKQVINTMCRVYYIAHL